MPAGALQLNPYPLNRHPASMRLALVPIGLVCTAALYEPVVAPQRHCLAYEPDTVAIEGKLERRTYFGPPGYGEHPRTDARETYFYLSLAAPVCTGAGHDSLIDGPTTNVRLVQLLLDSTGYAALRPYLRRRISLRGTLSGAITGHHHAPLLLDPVKPVHPDSLPSGWRSN